MRTNEEITEIYYRYVDMIYRLCFTILKNTHDTEDSVQNTFIKLINHKKEFENSEHEKAWLIRTATNISRDFLRKSSRKDTPLDEIEEKVPAEEHKTENIDLLNAVLSLDEKYREVIFLYYYEGYNSNEIAELLDKSASTIRSHLSEARTKLKIKLGGDYFEE